MLLKLIVKFFFSHFLQYALLNTLLVHLNMLSSDIIIPLLYKPIRYSYTQTQDTPSHLKLRKMDFHQLDDKEDPQDQESSLSQYNSSKRPTIC